MNAKFSSLLMECNSHLFSVLLCFKYLYEGEGGGGGGECPLAPCYHYVLGSRKTGL